MMISDSMKYDGVYAEKKVERPSTHTDIVLPFFNQSAFVVRCIRSLAASAFSAGRVILIDDASEPSERAAVETALGQLRLDALVVSHRSNQGFRASIQSGIEHCDKRYAILLNSDTIVTVDFDRLLLEAIMRDSATRAAGPVSNSPHDIFQYRPELEVPSGDDKTLCETIVRHAEYLQEQRAGKITEAPYLVGMCLAVDLDAFREVGGFSSEYKHGYFEDFDLCCRLRERGFRLAVREDCLVYHRGHASYRCIPRTRLVELIQGNYAHFSARWGHLATHETLLKLMQHAGEREPMSCLEASDTTPPPPAPVDQDPPPTADFAGFCALHDLDTKQARAVKQILNTLKDAFRRLLELPALDTALCPLAFLSECLGRDAGADPSGIRETFIQYLISHRERASSRTYAELSAELEKDAQQSILAVLNDSQRQGFACDPDRGLLDIDTGYDPFEAITSQRVGGVANSTGGDAYARGGLLHE